MGKIGFFTQPCLSPSYQSLRKDTCQLAIELSHDITHGHRLLEVDHMGSNQKGSDKIGDRQAC